MRVLIISCNPKRTKLVREALGNNSNVSAIEVVDTYEKAKGISGIRVIIDCIGNQLGIAELQPLCEKMRIQYKLPEFEKVTVG